LLLRLQRLQVFIQVYDPQINERTRCTYVYAAEHEAPDGHFLITVSHERLLTSQDTCTESFSAARGLKLELQNDRFHRGFTSYRPTIPASM
jgi:hypothetical protein